MFKQTTKFMLYKFLRNKIRKFCSNLLGSMRKIRKKAKKKEIDER